MTAWHLMSADDDWDRLALLDSFIYPADDCISGNEYRAYLREGNQSFLLLDGAGRWLANFQVVVNDGQRPRRFGSLELSPGHVYVSAVSVFPPFQNQGLGRVVMARLIEQFGHLVLTGRAREDNAASRSLLERHGFAYSHDQIREGSRWLWYTRRPGR